LGHLNLGAFAVKKNSNSDLPQARKPYTPRATQNRILEEHLNGKSIRKIAKMTGLDRGTVSRTLSQRELVEIVEEQRSRLFEMIPEAVSVMGSTLRSNDERLAASVAITMTKGTGILPKNIEMPEPERDRQRDQDAVMGQIIQMGMTKAVRYGTRLPDSLIEALRSVKETLEAYEAHNPRAAIASPDTSEF